MGGLAGVVHFEGPPPEAEVLEAMSRRLAHRGPDGQGSFAEGPAAFAHRRRSVVPTSSVQPVVADDVLVMMDGWIYDHREVASSLGIHTELASDTEALLFAWRRWGHTFTDHVEGEFAAAFWDRRSLTLHLFRDRMGIRPLFWARRGARFAFASELPALLEVPWIDVDIARENLAEYLSFRVVHAPRTLLRGVHQCEPAHWIRVNAAGHETRPYWRLQYAGVGAPRPGDGEVVRALQEAMDRSVARRLRDGAPAALYLSGGLGSTAIAASARELSQPLPSWTVSFADDPHPESPFAGRVASLLRLDHHELVVGSAEVAAAFDLTVTALGQPVGSPEAIILYLLGQRVREEARVVLTGDGSVELFGGRMLDPLARALRFATLTQALPRGGRRSLRAALSVVGRGSSLEATAGYGLERSLGGSDLFSADERRALLRDPGAVVPDVRTAVLTPFYADLDTDPFNAVLNAWLRSALCERALTRADRTAAAAGLDARFPLLDRDVLTMAAALPGSLKIRRVGGSLHTRWPLRTLLRGVLPGSLLHRPRRRAAAPLNHWLGGPGRLFLEERVRLLKQDPEGLWRPDAIDSLRDRVNDRGGAAIRLWVLFLLDAWLRQLRQPSS